MESAKISNEISLSSIEWVQTEKYKKENYNRKCEPNIDDEMALKFDFANKVPPIDIVKSRAKYRPELWFNCIPTEQRFMIITTYGPENEGYDINSEKIGFDFFGCFQTLNEVSQQIEKIRNLNPHAVFLTFHVLDIGMGKRIQLPPPNDGSLKNIHLNKEHQKIIEKYLEKQVNEVEFVENRYKDSFNEVQIKNEIVEDYNKSLEIHAMNILNMDINKKLSLQRKNKEKINLLLKEINLNELEKNCLNQNLNELNSITHDQIEKYINIQEKLIVMPDNYKLIYNRIIINSKEYLVRSIYFIE